MDHKIALGDEVVTTAEVLNRQRVAHDRLDITVENTTAEPDFAAGPQSGVVTQVIEHVFESSATGRILQAPGDGPAGVGSQFAAGRRVPRCGNGSPARAR